MAPSAPLRSMTQTMKCTFDLDQATQLSLLLASPPSKIKKLSDHKGTMRPSPFHLLLPFVVLLFGLSSVPAKGLMPYSRSPWDMMLPAVDDDPFRILEQTPFAVPKAVETLALARADWKETPQAHLISLDVPGVRKEDIKIEVEENRVVRITGERKGEEEAEGEKWHRAERTAGKFWRQFRLPASADLDAVKAQLEDGVLRVTVPKLAGERRRQPRLVNIVQETNQGGEDIKASKADL